MQNTVLALTGSHINPVVAPKRHLSVHPKGRPTYLVSLNMGKAPSLAPVSLNLVSANGGSVMSSSHVSKKNVRIQEISTPACVLQVA